MFQLFRNINERNSVQKHKVTSGKEADLDVKRDFSSLYHAVSVSQTLLR